MARARTRAASRLDDYGFNLVDQLLRPEVIITSVVLVGAVALRFLLPVGDLIADLRDSVVRAVGVHAATLALCCLRRAEAYDGACAAL